MEENKNNKEILGDIIRTIKESTNVRVLMDLYGVRYRHGDDGKIYRSACPIHRGDNPTAFTFNNETKHYRCFTNGCSGDVIEFVKRMEGINFWQALKKLGEINGIDVEDFDASDIHKNKYMRFVEKSKKYFEDIEKRKAEMDEGSNKARDEEEIKTYIPLPSICSDSSKRNIDYETQTDFNVMFGRMEEDPFRHIRIIMPIYDENNRYIGQVGRSWKDGISPKYWYQPKGLIKNLFNFNLNRAKYHVYDADHNIPTLFVCEGCFDVIKLWRMGYKNTIAIFGSEPTERQVKLMVSVADKIVLCLDDDISGVKATVTIFKIVAEKFPGLKLFVLPITFGKKDVGNMNEEQISEAMVSLLTPKEWVKQTKDRIDLDFR